MPDRRPFLDALGPTTEHLFRAVGEVIAAAGTAMDAIPEPIREKNRDALRTSRAALDLVGTLVRNGANTARERVKDVARREALEEIAAALDVQATRLSGQAAEALRVVREVVAGAARRAGGESARAESDPTPAAQAPARPARRSKPARRAAPGTRAPARRSTRPKKS